jgi:hypothetical protein
MRQRSLLKIVLGCFGLVWISQKRDDIFMTSNRHNSNAIQLLRSLQQQIAERDKDIDEQDDRISLVEAGDLVEVEYYGFAFGESFQALVNLLCNPEVAAIIQTLTIRSVDEGANGTFYWDFSELNRSSVSFPNLMNLFVEPYQAGWHNHPVIARTIEEEGMIGKLLAQMPKLKELTVPNAPDASFFQVGERPLTTLRVDSGYDHQNFILNFSRSSCFPALRKLDFGDFNEQYMENYLEYRTPFEHYHELFQSQAFAGVQEFVLRNSSLSPAQEAMLRRSRRDLTFRLIQTFL